MVEIEKWIISDKYFYLYNHYIILSKFLFLGRGGCGGGVSSIMNDYLSNNHNVPILVLFNFNMFEIKKYKKKKLEYEKHNKKFCNFQKNFKNNKELCYLLLVRKRRSANYLEKGVKN